MEACLHLAVQDFFEVKIVAFEVQRNEETKTDHANQYLALGMVKMIVQTFIIGEQSSLLLYNQRGRASYEI